MANAVFLHKPSSIYDDNPTERYHFPKMYLRAVEQTVGDFIIYFEPKRGGSHSYVATAQVTRIDNDPNSSGLFYARIDPVTYLPFISTVKYEGPGGVYEHALGMPDGSINRGLIQRAVRIIASSEYEAIMAAGMAAPDFWLHNSSDSDRPLGFSDQPQADFVRPTATYDRNLRSRAFTLQIQSAYDRTCAVTGLKILNGGGRPEVQAAHIKAVEDQGPDWVRNGVALSGTIHWMFDKGFISIADDYKILRADRLIPDEIKPLLNRSEYLRLPENPNLRPHPEFLMFHRESRYKGD